MATPPKNTDNLNKAVVAYLDGRRLKGCIYNFSALKESFILFPESDPLQHRGTEVQVKDLKAVFFVKNFAGNPGYHESQEVANPTHGHKVVVTFSDGEKMVGITEAYNPQKPGFFLFPADPNSNNIRIFVVNKNVRQVQVG